MDLQQTVKGLNETIKQLNSQNMTRRGVKESYMKQLDEEIARYKQAYGVELTPQNISEERDAVVKSTEDNVALMTQVVNCIEAEDFSGARRLLGVAESVVSEVVTGNVEVPTESPTDVAPTHVDVINHVLQNPVGITEEDVKRQESVHPIQTPITPVETGAKKAFTLPTIAQPSNEEGTLAESMTDFSKSQASFNSLLDGKPFGGVGL